jgi:hypothetical protein
MGVMEKKNMAFAGSEESEGIGHQITCNLILSLPCAALIGSTSLPHVFCQFLGLMVLRVASIVRIFDRA